MATTNTAQDIGSMRIIDMTAGQLVNFIAQQLGTPTATPDYVYGISGLAKLLGCSEATAWRIKKSGRLDDAISQIDGQIIIDAKKALALTRIKKDK